MRDICDNYEVFLILDEMKTGMGRTGTLGACEAFGLEYPTPEIGWAISKGLFIRGVVTGGTLKNASVNRIEPPGIIR